MHIVSIIQKNLTMWNLNTFKLLAFALCLVSSLAVSAQKTVTGRVTSADTNEGLAGVGILVKGTNSGTVSDVDGSYSVLASEGQTLVFTYVGMRRTEVPVGAGNTIDVAMEPDATTLSDVVVTTTRQPVRKLETTTAVEVIGAKQLQRIKPEGIAEAITSAPGVFTNTSQGRRGFIITRGFPDGSPTGGLVYTGIMLDGIPTFGTPGKLPEAGFGFDQNVERVEVVRGSAATLFGRASAAGVVNLITRTGGEKLGGSAKVTFYDDIIGTGNINSRIDLNLNGPISENLRFNIGGWYLQDDGFRNTGYKDEGGQIRANLDYLLPNKRGSIRLYGMYSDFNFQNLTDVAVNPATMQLADGWKNTDTYQSENLAGINFRIREGSGPAARDVLLNGQPIDRNLGDAMAGGSYGRGGHIGLNFNFDLGNGFSIDNKFRYQSIDSGVKYGFALPSFYSTTSVLRLYLDGDATDTDIINEFRISKAIDAGNSKHNISAGVYYSTINLLPTTYSYLYNSTTDPNNIQASAIFPPGAPAPTTGGITRRGEYDESVLAFFAGNEMKFDDKLTVNVGLRFDMLNLDMQETKNPFDSVMMRQESFQDWSASIGLNYLLTERSAIYGNVIRAFRMPDYSAFTSLERNPARPGFFLRAPDGINANEVIFNTELGYRTGIGDLGIDVAGFFTNIDNRLASVFEDGLLVSKPLGQNRIMGGELSLTYAPRAVRGLLLRSSLTLQDGRFVDFLVPVGRTTVMGQPTLNVNPNGELFGNKIVNDGKENYSIDLKGNRIPGVPDMIWNALVAYEHRYFGFDFSSNINTGRYGDATNVIDLGTLTILNAGAYAKLPIKKTEMRLGVQAKNLTNATAIQGIAGIAENDTALSTKQRNPNFENLLAHGYVQLPRRILLYLSYDF